jgi:hypothetical protein
MDYKNYVRIEYKKLFENGKIPDKITLKFYKYKRIKTDKWGRYAVRANNGFNYSKAHDWCMENCNGHFGYWDSNWVIFELKQDAFLFKLNF